MLKSDGGYTTFGVDDLEVAFTFYESLGLRPGVQQPGTLLTFDHGGSSVWVFEVEDYRPYNHPVLIFMARKLERTIEELTLRGVAVEPFDPYEALSHEERGITPETKTETVLVSFKDPAGNRFAVMRDWS